MPSEPSKKTGRQFPYRVDIVCISICDDRTLLGCSRAGVVGAEVLDDVVLDQWVFGPSIDSEVGISNWIVGSCVLDNSAKLLALTLSSQDKLSLHLPSRSSRHPTFSTNKIPASLPANGIFTSSSIGIRSPSPIIRPPRIVETTVRSSRTWSSRALGKRSWSTLRYR